MLLGLRRRRSFAALLALVLSLLFAGPALAASPYLEVIAGTAMPGAPTPGPALSSNMGQSASLAVDSKGNVYSADPSNRMVLRVDSLNLLSVYAGSGAQGTPVAGSALASPLTGPDSLAIAANDDLFVGDGSRVLRIDHATGMLSIFATGFTKAESMAFDAAGNLLVLDSGAHTITKLSPAGVKTPLVGTGVNAPLANAPAASATLGDGLRGIAIAPNGDVYWTASQDNRVGKLDVSTSTVSIFAGSGNQNGAEPGPALGVDIAQPGGIGIAANGDVYIGQMRGLCELLRVTPAGVLTFASGQYNGCVVPSSNVPFDQDGMLETWAVTVDSSGSIYLATLWARIMKVPGLAPPAAPADVTATPGNRKATVTFNDRKTHGSLPITGYQVSTDAGATWLALNTSSAGNGRLTGALTNLTNGVNYDVLVRAVGTTAGAGPAAAKSVTPAATAPDAPTGLSTQAKNAAAELTFFAPGDDGGATITGYEASTDGVNWTAITTTGGLNGAPLVGTLSGLTNGTTYDVAVRARNSTGAGTVSSTASVKPVTVPDAPSTITATRGNGQIDFTFTVPASDGGDGIIGYEASSDGGQTWNGVSTSPGQEPNALDFAIGGLDNGTTYTIQLRAVNTVGRSGVATAPAAKPAQSPHAPSINLAAGDSKITIAFTPNFDGGEPVLRWELTLDGGSSFNTITPTPGPNGSFTYVATGLTNGNSYSVGVRGVNVVGDGFSGKGMSATPALPPDAPTNLITTPGNRSAAIVFTEPANDGGSSITGYELSTDDGATWTTFYPSPGPNGTWVTTLSNLTNGTTYKVKVRAVNGAGAGAATAAATTALPVLVPDTPTNVSAVARNGAADLTFTTPAFDGGAAITRYEVSIDGGTNWRTVTTTDGGNGTRAARVTQLPNGAPVTIQVRAVNSAGAGPAAAAAPVTPVATVPETPTAYTVGSGDTIATVGFTPGDDGGSPILRYEVSLDNGPWVTLAGDRKLPSLVNRQTYSVRLRAVNAIGDSAPTAPAAVTPYVATAPSAPGATANTSSITATWAVPTPSTDITGYTAYAFPGPSKCTTKSVNDTSCVLGAAAGTTYTIKVVAHGANGVDSAASPASAPVTPALPATPAQPPADAPLTLTTDKGQIALAVPDQPITVIGTGFAPYSTAKVIIYSTPQELGIVQTDGNGNFSVPVRVPANLHAGAHTFLATGVDPSGGPRAMALPVTVPPTRVDSSGGGDGNQTKLPVPAGGSITLLDAAGTATSTVAVPGQGTYVLDPSTGTIAFIPVKGFSGRATAVTYRLTDSVGSSVTGTYSALVTAAAGPDDDGAATPPPAGAGKPGVKAGRSVAKGARTPVTCTLTGATLERCEVKLYAKLSGRSVLVGTGTGGATVTVKLTAAGRGLVNRIGGAELSARATITQRGLATRLTASRAITVVADAVKLGRVVQFASGSAKATAADRRYLAGVRKQLDGARTVTCVGHTDDLGTGNVALGKRRAAAVCAELTRGLTVKAKLVTRADRKPRATNSTVAGRSENRRATVTVGY